MRKEKERKKTRKKEKKEGHYGHFTFLMYFKQSGGAVFPNVFKTASTPPEKPEPELFLEELEPCQTGPKCLLVSGAFLDNLVWRSTNNAHHISDYIGVTP